MTPEETRESIWSVPSSWRKTYFNLFSLSIVIGTAFTAWNKWTRKPPDWSVFEIVQSTCRSLAPMLVAASAWCVILVEIFNMWSETYRQWLHGKIEQKVAREVAKEKTAARVEEYKRWEAWNTRREDAASQGRPFSEPPPARIEINLSE